MTAVNKSIAHPYYVGLGGVDLFLVNPLLIGHCIGSTHFVNTYTDAQIRFPFFLSRARDYTPLCRLVCWSVGHILLYKRLLFLDFTAPGQMI